MWSWSSEEPLVFFKLLFGMLTSTCTLFFGAAVAYLMPLSQGGTGAAALRQVSSLLWPAPIPKELRDGEQEPLPGAEEKRERTPDAEERAASLGTRDAAEDRLLPGYVSASGRRQAGRRAPLAALPRPSPAALPARRAGGRAAMGSRLSRQSGAEVTGVRGCSKRSLRGSSRPEEPPCRLGRDCRLASLLLGSEKLPAGLRKNRPAAPYVRRVGWIRQIQATLRQHQPERAMQLLRLLRKDLGLEGTFLNEVLYKKATFLNLVDPISHDLPDEPGQRPAEYDPWKSSDRICRQLIYHLTPHSKWHRSGLPHRKSHSSLNSSLQKQLGQEAIHLSGVPLSTRDIQHLASYLQGSGDHLLTIDLSFTSLKDEEMRFLMPFLRSLPSLTHLSLNGNHLTRATVKDLTDAMKDMAKFPSLAWIDLGNNVDVSSMPQPLLVGLRKRLSQQTTLPTIYESLDCASEASSRPETSLLEEDLQGEEGIPPVAKHRFHQQSCER
ncbi:hypothetical protein E2320_012794 [Naja naja]|nr:hypothetical protein E2320_012794 [Naja naja]